MVTLTRRLKLPARFCAVALAAALTAGLRIHPAHAAQQQSAFVTDLKAQNAQHLAAKPKTAKESKPPTLEREYEDKLTRTEWRLGDGPLEAAITLKRGGPPDGTIFLGPILTLRVEGKEVLRVEGSESFPDNPIFLIQIAEMDPENPHKEVVFSTYTGGAHCCSDTRLLTSSRDGAAWREIEAGLSDGGPLGVRDLDGDGRYEFALRDNAFLYTFACYACSTAPLQVLRLEGGKLTDVSAQPAFHGHQVQSLIDMLEWADDESDRNGFLAGYVAQKILLGEGKPAWELMLKHYDRKSDWGLETCTAKLDAKGECPKDKTVMLSFPDALRRFLKENGYDLEL